MSALVDRLATLSPEKRQVVARQLDPLSFVQERLWFLHQLAPHLPVYNIPLPLLLSGPIDIPVLARSLAMVAERHEILRTTFPSIDGQPVQHVSREAAVSLAMVDLTQVRAMRQDDIRQRVLDSEAQRPMDVERGPLWRALIVRLAWNSHVLMLTWHHLVFDGWSRTIFLGELGHISARLASGQAPALAPLTLQYRHVARGQRARLQGETVDEQLAYWRAQLGGDLPPLDLPTTRVRPVRPTQRGADEMFSLPADLVAALRAIGERDGITLFMTLLTGWALLMQKYGGVRDVIIGTVSSGRSRPELEALIGCFVNTLALRITTAGTPTVRELLARVRGVALGAFAHQDLPFEKLVSEVRPERRADETPLFRTWMTLENTPSAVADRDNRAAHDMRPTVEELAASDRTAKFDLALTVKESAAGVLGPLRYATDLFDRETIVRLLRHLTQMFRGMAAQPDAHVSDLSLLTDAERAQLLQPPDAGLHRSSPAIPHLVIPAFESRAAQRPEAVAVTWRDRHLTYGELNRRVNALAHDLRAAGADTETLAAVCLDRTPDLVIALLAILKAGAAFVPIDPALPPARLNVLLDDIRPRLVITQQAHLSRMAARRVPVLCLDTPRVASEIDTNPPLAAGPSNMAYVIYTSGSTGQPKGVVIEQSSLANFLTAMDDVLGPVDDMIWMAATSPTFDISLLELLWTVTRGMQIVLPSSPDLSVRVAPVQARRTHTTFSLFYFASDADARAGAERYRLLLDGARFADAHGFSSIWMPERHFHSFGGIYPNPSVTAAAVAAITTRVQIRAGSVVLPLHDPIRVAEEWAVVDNLSNGRVGISFASGWHANDFVLAPARYESRRESMAGMLDDVRRLWRGESIARRGPTGQEVDVRIRPRPVQPELPVWITSGGTPETFRLAGALGAHLLTHLLGQSVEDLAAKIAIYRAAWREHGHGPGDGHVTLMLHTFLGDDAEQVQETVREPFSSYLRDSVSLLSDLARSFGGGQAVDRLKRDDLDALVAHAYTRYVGTSGLFGTPDSALSMVTRLQECGVDEIGCLIDFGIEANEVLRGLRHLAQLRDLVQADADLSIGEVMIRRGVTHLQCTPTWARLLMMDGAAPRAIASLAALLVGGEALPAPLAADLCALGPQHLHHMYGPTETTIWSSTDRLTAQPDVTIGRALAGNDLHVVDRDVQLMPPGIAGELYIGGRSVARGYWQRPDLTADRFIPDPFGAASGGRLYRTGDRVRRRDDGRIDYLGRTDYQVKLHGRRIELPEIEAVLRAQPGVRDAVVLLREDSPGEPRLVAYIVLASGLAMSPETLRQWLRTQVPEYMVPAVIVMLDALPMTASGKINRRALPAPSDDRPALADGYAAPRTPAEAALARVWSEVLRLERVGVHDNFFALGGDSILSLQIVARAMQAGWRLAPRHLFEHQTVATLAQVAQPATGAVVAEQTVVGPVPLLPIQAWFFEQPRPAAHHYNQQVLLEVDPAAARVLPRAWAALLAHHDALRFRFATGASGWRQTGTKAGRVPYVPVIDLEAVDARARHRVWERTTGAVQASLHLGAGPVARPVVLRAPNGVAHLFIVAHHLVIDGVSWRVLLADLQLACRQLLAGEPIDLPPKTSSVRQWARGLEGLASSDALAAEIEFWTQMSEPAAVLPPALAGEARLVGQTRTHVSDISREDTTALIQELPGHRVGQVQELLLTALVQALAESTGESVWRIDLEGHGREWPGDTALDASRTVGWFTSLYPVRLSAASAPLDTLRAVKTTLRSVPHRGTGYGVLRYLDTGPGTRTLRAAPRAEIIFNYLGQFDQVLEPEGAMRPARLPVGAARDRRQPREYALEINSLVRGGRLQVVWTHGHGAGQAAAIERLAARFAEALRTLIAASRASGEARPWLVPADVPLAAIGDDELREYTARGPVVDIYPLSPMQQGLLFHSLYDADRSTLYTIQFHSRVDEALDVEIFREAWQRVVARHPVLRTSFVWQRPDRPLQIVFESVSMPCTVDDVRELPEAEQEARRQELIEAEQRRGFDLDRAPLMRVALLRLSDTAWHIVWTAHHLVVDGWSVPLVMGEVLRTYHARLAGRQPAIAPSGQFGDYIAWVQRQDLAKAEAYWRHTLADVATPSLLAPGTHALHRTVSTHMVNDVLPSEVGERLHALGRTHALTLNTWLVGAWALVLAHYTNRRDVIFGTVVSGRPAHLPDVERTVGVFANTLPLRVTINPAESTLAWLARIQWQQTDARDYEHIALGSIQGWSAMPAGTPLFDTLFLYENFPAEPTPSTMTAGTETGTGGTGEDAGSRFVGNQASVVIPTTFPLVLQVDPSRTQIGVEAVVDPTAIPPDRAQEILDTFQSVVERMTTAPEGEVGDWIEFLVSTAREKLSEERLRTRERNRGRLRRFQRN